MEVIEINLPITEYPILRPYVGSWLTKNIPPAVKVVGGKVIHVPRTRTKNVQTYLLLVQNGLVCVCEDTTILTWEDSLEDKGISFADFNNLIEEIRNSLAAAA